MTDTTESRVAAAFRDALELPDDVDVTVLTYRAHPNWTSLGHMALVAALEDSFDAMLESEEILDMSSFAKAVEIMGRYDESH